MSKFEASKLVSQYFREFQKAAQLTAEEEKDLSVRIQSGDKSALAVMIKHNLKLVVKIANRHIGQGVPIDDLIQEGNLGLMEAARRYLPDTDARFALSLIQI
jgi:RNA polymerase primary sigma factor